MPAKSQRQNERKSRNSATGFNHDPRVISPQTDYVVDMLEELQALNNGQQATPAVKTPPVLFSKGDVVTLKHNWKQHLEPFFLAILCDDLHCSNYGIFEPTMHLNWLELSEEDPLVYIVGNEDKKNPPQYILGIASVDQNGETYIPSRNEEQRLKNLANGSNEDDSESSDAEGTDGDNREDDDQPTGFEAGHSRSGRRVTIFCLTFEEL